jgi:hypothetical protein
MRKPPAGMLATAELSSRANLTAEQGSVEVYVSIEGGRVLANQVMNAIGSLLDSWNDIDPRTQVPLGTLLGVDDRPLDTGP